MCTKNFSIFFETQAELLVVSLINNYRNSTAYRILNESTVCLETMFIRNNVIIQKVTNVRQG